jgi:hypothetical protein
VDGVEGGAAAGAGGREEEEEEVIPAVVEALQEAAKAEEKTPRRTEIGPSPRMTLPSSTRCWMHSP